jgi:hypothetical protein
VQQATAAPSALLQARARLRGLADLAAKLPRPVPPTWLLIVGVVAVVSWPFNASPPSVGGYDISWITALHVAAHDGLHFGSQFNDTYGPLGYLTIPNLFYDGTGLPADLVTGALYVGLLVVVARPLFRALGLVGGGLLLFVLARLVASQVDPVELLTPLIVAIAIVAVRRDGAELERMHAIGISILAAFMALGKESAGPVGLSVVVVLAITTAARGGSSLRERARGAAILLGSFLAGVIVLWLLAGQSIFDLPAYVRNSFETITGYDDAEALSAPNLDWQYVLAAVSSIIVLSVGFWRDRELPPARRCAAGLLWLLFASVTFRHAFVRFGPGHAVLFFGPLALLAAPVLIDRARWRTGLLACLVPLGVVWYAGPWDVPGLFSVSTTGFVQQINMLLGPNLRDTARSRARVALRASYGLSSALLTRIGGQTVHFEPFEAAIAWAYPQIRWHPPPFFQSNDAYTSYLDDLNAQFLASSGAPRYVLRENVALDGRNPRFESPRYMLEMICRYQQVMTVPGWQLLRRSPDRCGAPAPAGSQRVKFGQRVAAPPATQDSIVVASFTDFSMPVSDTLGRLFFKRPIQYMSVNSSIFRFVPGHASNPHVLSFPQCLGWSPALWDPTPYRSIGLGHLPQLATPGATESSSYRVTFERIPFRCQG